MKKDTQVFRFCCGCTRMSLITDDGCYFCGSKFVVAAKTDDLNIRPRQYAKTH